MRWYREIRNILKKPRVLLCIMLLPPAVFFAIPPTDILLRSGSCTLVSQEGMVLHVFRDRASGSFQEWIAIDELPAYFIHAVLMAEDKRFYHHPGIDPIAFVRAIWQNISSLKLISGASTITQQLVRIAYAGRLPKNSFLRKIFEWIHALKLELHYSKRKILEAYINLVPFPNNCAGVAMASRRLFNHDARHLTPDESCALAVLIRRTSMPQDAFVRRYEGLRVKLAEAGIIASDKKESEQMKLFSASLFDSMRRSAGRKDIPLPENQFNRGGIAPHFVAFFREKFPDAKGKIVTTLSANMNKTIHEIVKNELESIKKYGGTNGAVLVMEVPENDGPLLLRAMVGSADYYDELDGQVNGALSIRSAGSTLKPFIYALAIDLFDYRPWTLLSDSPVGFETDVEGEIFQPQNYDLRFWGSMTLRDALATSRNIPAVWLMRKIGEEKFYAFLESAGFDHLRKGPHHHGPGMALGSAGASLLQLVMAYGALASKGEMRPLCAGKLYDGAELLCGTRKKLFSEKSAYYITHILADREARRRAFGKRNFQDFPFEVASKTGTSSDYRDAWIIGYTEKYVVGVWVGNFSGKKMQGVSGGWGGGRIFHQVMRMLAHGSSPRFHYPASWTTKSVCRLTGKLAGAHCRTSVELVSDNDRLEKLCDVCPLPLSNMTRFGIAKPEIISPADGQVFLLDPHISSSVQQVPIIIHCPPGNAARWSFTINEGVRKSLSSDISMPVALGPGNHTIRLYDGDVLVKEFHFQVVR